MDRVELLTVEDSFQIAGRGLVISPDFAIPSGWKNRTETVVVVKPDGKREDATGEFGQSHFKPLDPTVPIERHWRVVLMLKDYKTNEVPIGSKILVSNEARDAIMQYTPV